MTEDALVVRLVVRGQALERIEDVKLSALEPGRDAEFRRATALEGTGFDDQALDRIGQGQDRVNERHGLFLEMGAGHVARDRREATGKIYPLQYR